MVTLSTQDLLHLAASSPKETKALVKALVSAPSAELAVGKSTPNTIQTLLQSLATNAITPAQVKHTLENASWFKNAPSLPNQLQTLVTLTQNDPALKPFSQALQGFLKEIVTTNGAELKQQLVRSGTGFEAALRTQSLPVDVALHRPLRQLQETLGQLPLPKTTQATLSRLFQEVLTPSTQKTPQEALKIATTALATQLQVLSKRPLFPLAEKVATFEKTLTKLQSTAAKEALQHPLLSRQAPQLPLTQETKSVLIALLKELKENPLPLPKSSQNTPQIQHLATHTKTQTIALLESILKHSSTIKHDLAPVLQAKAIPPPPSTQGTIKHKLTPLHVNAKIPSLTQEAPTDKPSATLLHVTPKAPLLIGELAWSTQAPQHFSPLLAAIPNDTEAQLKRAVSALKTLIKLLDATTLELPKALTLTKEHVLALKQQLAQAGSGELPKAIMSDVKKTLLELQNASSTSHKEVNQLATKSLAQIEMHQLYGHVSQSAHTYLPYLWSGLKHGSLMVQKREEATYCQINLEFEHYRNVHIMLVLFDTQHINVSIALESPELKTRISEHIQELRLMLYAVGITPSNITLLPYEKRESLEKNTLEGDFGINLTA